MISDVDKLSKAVAQSFKSARTDAVTIDSLTKGMAASWTQPAMKSGAIAQILKAHDQKAAEIASVAGISRIVDEAQVASTSLNRLRANFSSSGSAQVRSVQNINAATAQGIKAAANATGASLGSVSTQLGKMFGRITAGFEGARSRGPALWLPTSLELMAKAIGYTHEYAEAYKQANPDFAYRQSLLKSSLSVQRETGAAVIQVVEAQRALVDVGLDENKMRGSILKNVVQLNRGLDVSISESTELFRITSRLGGGYDAIADTVAEIAATTALSAGEAAKYASAIGKSIQIYTSSKSGFDQMAKQVLTIESAFKEVLGTSGEFTNLISSINSGKLFGQMYGVHSGTVTQDNGGVEAIDATLSRFNKQLLSITNDQQRALMASAYSQAYFKGAVSAESLLQYGAIHEQLQKRLADEQKYESILGKNSALQEMYNANMADMGSAFGMLLNSGRAALTEALIPVSASITKMARALLDLEVATKGYLDEHPRLLALAKASTATISAVVVSTTLVAITSRIIGFLRILRNESIRLFATPPLGGPSLAAAAAARRGNVLPVILGGALLVGAAEAVAHSFHKASDVSEGATKHISRMSEAAAKYVAAAVAFVPIAAQIPGVGSLLGRLGAALLTAITVPEIAIPLAVAALAAAIWHWRTEIADFASDFPAIVDRFTKRVFESADNFSAWFDKASESAAQSVDGLTDRFLEWTSHIDYDALSNKITDVGITIAKTAFSAAYRLSNKAMDVGMTLLWNIVRRSADVIMHALYTAVMGLVERIKHPFTSQSAVAKNHATELEEARAKGRDEARMRSVPLSLDSIRKTHTDAWLRRHMQEVVAELQANREELAKQTKQGEDKKSTIERDKATMAARLKTDRMLAEHTLVPPPQYAH